MFLAYVIKIKSLTQWNIPKRSPIHKYMCALTENVHIYMHLGIHLAYIYAFKLHPGLTFGGSGHVRQEDARNQIIISELPTETAAVDGMIGFCSVFKHHIKLQP